MNVTTKKFIMLIIMALFTLNLYAQQNEPVSNIGRTMYEMRQEFQNLEYYGKDRNGEEYIFRDPNGGDTSFHFVFFNNRVVKEYMKSQDNEGFSILMFNQFCKTFVEKYRWALQINNTNHKQFVFRNYTLDIILKMENNKNTMLFMYQKR